MSNFRNIWLTASVDYLAKAMQHRTAKHSMAQQSACYTALRSSSHKGSIARHSQTEECVATKYKFCNALSPEMKGLQCYFTVGFRCDMSCSDTSLQATLEMVGNNLHHGVMCHMFGYDMRISLPIVVYLT